MRAYRHFDYELYLNPFRVIYIKYVTALLVGKVNIVYKGGCPEFCVNSSQLKIINSNFKHNRKSV